MPSRLSRLRENVTHSLNLKSKFHFVLLLLTFISFFLAFLSIPLCSFNKQLYIVTWGLTLIFLLLMLLETFFYRKIQLDIITVSLILFPVSAVISSALAGFKGFIFTPIFLSLCTAVIYMFCKSDRPRAKCLIYLAALADIIFMIVFLYHYRSDIIHLNFNRLGSAFGDENDISLFMAFGMIIMAYISLFNKKIVLKILAILFGAAFILCGFSSGSKIFIVIFAFFVVVLPFMLFGKKRWWAATILVAGLIVAAVIMLSLPVFSTMRQRLFDFFSTILGKKVDPTSKTYDLSTIERIEMFFNGMQMFFRKPLFGWGIWGFATFGGYTNSWSHNNISESLCNFGLVGTFLFHYGFFSSFYFFFKSNSDEKKNNYLPLCVLMLFIVAMLSVAHNSQKLYAFLIGPAYALMANSRVVWSIGFEDLRRRRDENSRNCVRA